MTKFFLTIFLAALTQVCQSQEKKFTNIFGSDSYHDCYQSLSDKTTAALEEQENYKDTVIWSDDENCSELRYAIDFHGSGIIGRLIGGKDTLLTLSYSGQMFYVKMPECMYFHGLIKKKSNEIVLLEPSSSCDDEDDYYIRDRWTNKKEKEMAIEFLWTPRIFFPPKRYFKEMEPKFNKSKK